MDHELSRNEAAACPDWTKVMRALPTWKQPYRDGEEDPKAPPRPAFMHRPSVQMGEKSLQDEVATRARLKHILKSLSRVIFGIDLLAVLLVSSIVTLLVNSMSSGNVWLSFLLESKAAISTLGAFYSFALVFRTNICYSRWWEGRTLWGSIIIYTIRITQQGQLWIEDEALLARLSCLAITFSYACKAQLRGKSIEDDEEDGAKLVLKGVISQEEINMIARTTAWQPYYCIDAMRATINEGLKADRGNMDDWRKSAAHHAMEDTICTLSSSIGGCIRVRSTGLPVAYDEMFYAMGGIFFTAACLAWAPAAGFYNPIIVLVIYIVVKMIVVVGNDMEDPFGFDKSDLPLEKFCATIERQINAIDERADMITYNLAYGPPSYPSSSYSTFGSTLSSPATTVHSLESDDDDIEIGLMLETDPLVV